MKHLTYLLPSDRSHLGIRKKVDGQIAAFSKQFSTTLLYLKSPLHYPAFHIQALIKTIKSDVIYCRYNPKVPLLNILLAILSKKKHILMEHNIKFDVELAYLKRPIEKLVHQLTEKITLKSNIHHIAVSEEIRRHIIENGAKKSHTTTIQNGYQLKKIIPENIDKATLNQVKTLRPKYQHLLVFIGNHYPWHGLDMIIDDLSLFKNVGLLIIGPADKMPTNLPSFCHNLGACNSDTIAATLSHCDFGFGPFRWDKINITEGSPLKTREYLCNGVPIIVNYHDGASEIKALTPYVFNKKQSPNAIQNALNSQIDKQTLKEIAVRELSWDVHLKPLIDRYS